MARRKKFALIWWVDTAEKDVIPLLTFPTKQREVGCIAKLPWTDFKTGKTTHALAKIVFVGGTYLFCFSFIPLVYIISIIIYVIIIICWIVLVSQH